MIRLWCTQLHIPLYRLKGLPIKTITHIVWENGITKLINYYYDVGPPNIVIMFKYISIHNFV